MKTSDIKLLGADDALIAQTAAEALADGTASTPNLSVKASFSSLDSRSVLQWQTISSA